MRDTKQKRPARESGPPPFSRSPGLEVFGVDAFGFVLRAQGRLSLIHIFTKHGREVAVVISSADFERLSDRPKSSLVDFLRSGPEFQIPDRDRTPVREIDF